VFRVTRSWLVEAPNEESARLVADGSAPDLEYVRPADLPDGRYVAPLDVQQYYEQPIEVLDRAWDDYMDRSLPNDLTGSTRPQLPDLALMSPAITTQHLSMLFDCAISAYRRSYEGGWNVNDASAPPHGG
jgi:hypothetical protein